jgi:3-oxoacyl-[acyl-carrier protein] reductase
MHPKNYLIVGASQGIGKALSLELIAQGHRVFNMSRSAPAHELTGHIPFDATTSLVDVTALPESLDGLVYCPGSIVLKPFHRFTDEDFMQDFTLNTLGAARVIRATLPLLKQSEMASIILFSTVAVQQGMPFHASIAMAKGAIEGLGRSLAAELAPKIRVNVIAPSLTNTPLASKLLSSEDKIKAAGDRHPLKRVGESSDLAHLANFLLSEQSSWITGQVIGADGGMSNLRP